MIWLVVFIILCLFGINNRMDKQFEMIFELRKEIQLIEKQLEQVNDNLEYKNYRNLKDEDHDF